MCVLRVLFDDFIYLVLIENCAFDALEIEILHFFNKVIS